MKKILTTTLLLVLFYCVNSCINTPQSLSLSDAGNKIATKYNTTDIIVGTLITKSTDSEYTDAYTITIGNVKAIEEEHYAPLLVASDAAIILYDILTPQEREANKSIQVTVLSKSGEDEFVYPISELRKISGFTNIATNCLKKVIAQKYDELYASFDHNAISKNDFYTTLVEKALKPNQALINSLQKCHVKGFEFSENEGKKFLTMYLGVTKTSGTPLLVTITCNNDKFQKITSFWLKG